MVNTYFRLSDRKALIDAAEIRLISPNYVNTNVETLSVPAEVVSAFHETGTPWSSTWGRRGRRHGLGTLPPGFRRAGPGAAGGAERGQRPPAHVRHAGEDPFSPLCHGTLFPAEDHRLREQHESLLRTTEAELQDGYEVLKAVSEQSGIPVAYTSGRGALLDAFRPLGRMRAMWALCSHRHLYHRDWDSFTRLGR
jgi:hypothetical protein